MEEAEQKRGKREAKDSEGEVEVKVELVVRTSLEVAASRWDVIFRHQRLIKADFTVMLCLT